jgi:hypothetical protein
LEVRDPRDAEQMLGRIIDPMTREATLQELKSMPHPPLDRLIEHLGNGRVDRRLAAAKALGEVCDPQLVARLRWMVQRNVHRREALAALLQCHQPQAGEFLLAARGNRVIDAEIRSVQMQMKQFF